MCVLYENVCVVWVCVLPERVWCVCYYLLQHIQVCLHAGIKYAHILVTKNCSYLAVYYFTNVQTKHKNRVRKVSGIIALGLGKKV